MTELHSSPNAPADVLPPAALAPGGAADAGVATLGWVDALVRPGAATGQPVYVETDDPAVVERVLALTPALPSGQEVQVVALAPGGWPAPTPAWPERVRVWAGPSGGAGLAAWLKSRLTLAIRGMVLVQPGLRERVVHEGRAGIGPIVERACQEQNALLQRLHAVNTSRYAGRDAAWWGARFGAALDGAAGRASGAGQPGTGQAGAATGAPLRVLILTTRYSTFVQHSARDLASALRGQGCEAHVLIEPDACAVLTSVAHAHAVHDLEPDLIVAINYARAHLGPALGVSVPMVCWVQDALAHLFDARAGQAGGPLDFLVGHAHPALFTQFGYAPERALAAPVPVCARTFHARAAAAHTRERFACEVAYVGHQSEEPARLRERLLREARAAGPGNILPAFIEAVWASVERVCSEPLGEAVNPRLESVARATLRDLTRREPGPDLVTQVMNRVVKPLGDRVIRHQMLGWAAEIARARGWRLHLYGRGWDAAESLLKRGGVCAGEVTHDEALRACYQGAACHLHASISTSLHQRVLECVLSGGLMLVRLKGEDLEPSWLLAQLAVARAARASFCLLQPRAEMTWTADVAEAMACVALRQRLGIDDSERPAYALSTLHLNEREPALRGDSLVMHADAVNVLGDLAEVGFSTRAQLEARIERSVAGGRWRTQIIEASAARARSRLTYDAVSERLLGFLRDALAAGGGAARQGAGFGGPA